MRMLSSRCPAPRGMPPTETIRRISWRPVSGSKDRDSGLVAVEGVDRLHNPGPVLGRAGSMLPPARPVRRGRQPAEARRQEKLRPPEIPRVEPVPGRMVCFFGPDSNGALPDPPGHLDPVRVLRQEPPLALFSGFGCPPTPARREKRPCVAPVGVQACQIVSPVSRSRAAMMAAHLHRPQPAQAVPVRPPGPRTRLACQSPDGSTFASAAPCPPGSHNPPPYPAPSKVSR